MKKVNTLCIIDDDSVYQFLTTKVVSESRLLDLIKVFSNGQEAIEFFRKAKTAPDELPDIIFLDLTMPVMDGWDFLGEYVSIQPQFEKKKRLFIVTSSIAPSDMIRARSISMVSDFIVKPVTKDKILHVLKHVA
jgi:CheY-like chemotaxis protein